MDKRELEAARAYARASVDELFRSPAIPDLWERIARACEGEPVSHAVIAMVINLVPCLQQIDDDTATFLVREVLQRGTTPEGRGVLDLLCKQIAANEVP